MRFEQPVACYAGQRLVLRRPGVHGQATIAGGEILDPEPPRGKGSVSLAASQVSMLLGKPQERLLALALESRGAGISASALVRRLRPDATNVVKKLVSKGELIPVLSSEQRWIHHQICDVLIERIMDMVRRHHDTHPMSAGMPEAEVSSQLPPPESHLALTVVEEAIKRGKLLREGAFLAIPGLGAAVDAQDRTDIERILGLIKSAGVTPPFDSEVSQKLALTSKRLGQLLSLLRRQHRLTKIADGLHYDSETLKTISEKVIAGLRENAIMTASELKPFLGGVSRKWAIPLLEYFDRHAITVRQGSQRKLHPSQE
ncbi:MAG: SelB C-terminal domain-containing protein [Myxococcota bacterium]